MVYRKNIIVSDDTVTSPCTLQRCCAAMYLDVLLQHGVLVQAFIQLVGTLVILLGTLAFNKFVLTPRVGYFLMSLYVLFVIISFATN